MKSEDLFARLAESADGLAVEWECGELAILVGGDSVPLATRVRPFPKLCRGSEKPVSREDGSAFY